MLTDVLIMAYIVLNAILIFQAEKLPQNSLKIVLAGVVLTPLIGFALLSFYQKQLNRSYK